MESALHVKKWSNRFDNLDEEVELKQMLAALENENGRLKQLVVRLSAMILRNVTGRP
jgi:hypothetical protein